MNAEPDSGPAPRDAPAGAVAPVLLAQRIGLWLMLSAAGTIAIAWIAIQLQNHRFAPIGLTGLAIGVAVAVVCRRAATAAGAPTRMLGMIVAIGGALLVIAAQDYIGFWEHVRERERFAAGNPKAALFAQELANVGPAAFMDYFRGRLASQPVEWGIDATLTVAAAIAWTMAAGRRRSRGDELASGAPRSSVNQAQG